MIRCSQWYKGFFPQTLVPGERCGQFLFQLPDLSLQEYSSNNELVLVLIDERDRVVLYIPVTKDVDSYYIVLVRVGENITNDISFNQTFVSLGGTEGMMHKFCLLTPFLVGGFSYSSNQYKMVWWWGQFFLRVT